ncbi:uncharacterized protein LOC128177638 [Crassostrea angulata]|uniref:uncharacterized protein LOC128177638 n=1 Tax=Magallana angulata TaxID=2784310 RepID=UPI0022B16739|nr:uncharacterized protein LOC128177638 [Crassostrea angulata]
MDTSVSRWIIWISFLCLVLHSTELNTTASAGDLSTEELQNITKTIVNDVQAGSILLNLLNSTGVAIAEPRQDPEDPNWQVVLSDTNIALQTLAQPSEMRLSNTIVPLHEGAPFSTQPKLQIYDSSGNVIDKLGTNTNPWQITASIVSGTGHAAGQLTGTTTVPYQYGLANFTDLAISHFGDDYGLNFTVTYPVGVNLFTLTNFSLTRRPLKVNAMSIPTTVVANSSISLMIKLEDAVTSQIIEQTHWRITDWEVCVTLDGLEFYKGKQFGELNTKFNATTGLATLSDIRFTEPGMVILKIGVTSVPAEYSLETQLLINIRRADLYASSRNSSTQMLLRFEAYYNSIVAAGYQLPFETVIGNFLIRRYPDIDLDSVQIDSGGVTITYQITSGGSLQTNGTLILCDALDDGTSEIFGLLNFITLN